MSASYSASLLVVLNSNLNAYVYSFPSRFTNISPAPEPSELEASSVNSFYVFSGSGSGSFLLVPPSFSSSLSIDDVSRSRLGTLHTCGLTLLHLYAWMASNTQSYYFDTIDLGPECIPQDPSCTSFMMLLACISPTHLNHDNMYDLRDSLSSIILYSRVLMRSFLAFCGSFDMIPSF
nr:hypothetical protein [Tanacetum cinerariifolium]